MVISQFAALELAESCGRVERPIRQLFAWLIGSRPPAAQMRPLMPVAELSPSCDEAVRAERAATTATAADITVQS